ncbi:MAG: LysM peptidoglycan-binding domain-containing M23 family metallopeptidase [Synergistaceae bacterium]|nr:LysM peptidoglycan-binding domain-containing M23 family metallopeptidase [Synergistaceae bacterium]MBR0258573.1 LysM peptidoglycan-binding domain-containing M23 family metallopeptidase [Synergistaceae bacterium]
MRSDNERLRVSYPYHEGRTKSRKKKQAGVSLCFCWGFGAVVCLTFGLASFLMFSAGHFSSFSPGLGVEPAHGGIEDFTFSRSLLDVEVTDIETNEGEEFYAQAYDSAIMEEFGPLPSYLSDYESVTLTTENNGTTLNAPYDDEEEDDTEEVSVPAMKVKAEQPLLTESGPGWREHAVKNGETLSDIAHEHGNITAQDILKANGLKDANRLSENQLLLIPNDPSKVDDTLDEVQKRKMVIAANNEKSEPIKTREYVVAPGDSLWSIAQSQKIEIDSIIGSNNFKSSAALRPGLKLRIPNQEGIFYELKDGEKAEDIARRYRVSMSKVRLVNEGVNLASLKKGDEIFLPGAKPEAVRDPKPATRLAEVKKPETAKKSAPAPKTAVKPEKRQRGEVAVRVSGLRWPIMGRINSPFGWRQHPITRRRDFHTGIDIKANRNDPIKAAGSGHVVYSGWMGGYGKVLVIEHSNGQSTLYAHCSTLLAGKGASVSSGQLVAKIGTTGRSTGPHLHFEVRNGNSPVNPIKYLSR